MTNTQVLTEGLNLLVIGMGTVFVFLSVLVACVTLMSKMAQKIEARFPKPVEVHKAPQAAVAGVQNEHIAAIGAAVRRYRSSRLS